MCSLVVGKTGCSRQVDGVVAIASWERFGYLKSNDRPIANADLWKQVAFWIDKCPQIIVTHVRDDDTHVMGNTEGDRRRLRDAVR